MKLSDPSPNVKYVVMNENTLGYIFDEQPNTLQILHGSILRGSNWDWKDGQAPISSLDKIRAATLKDFEIYRNVPPPNFELYPKYV